MRNLKAFYLNKFMKKYKYKIEQESCRMNEFQDELNKQAKDGWEFMHLTDTHFAVYRKEIIEQPPVQATVTGKEIKQTFLRYDPEKGLYNVELTLPNVGLSFEGTLSESKEKSDLRPVVIDSTLELRERLTKLLESKVEYCDIDGLLNAVPLVDEIINVIINK